jgi:hypothetical protein
MLVSRDLEAPVLSRPGFSVECRAISEYFGSVFEWDLQDLRLNGILTESRAFFLPGREACNAILRWHYYADFQIEIFSKNVP